MKINPDFQVGTNAEAYASKLTAKKLRRKNAGETLEECSMLEIAQKLEKSAENHLTLEEMPERGMGGELIYRDNKSSSALTQNLKNPDRITVDASIDRVELAHKNGVLSMALDTAETIGAKNSAEQMLAHQMAAIHKMSLDLMAQAGNTRDPVEKCRLINCAARLMDVYQKGMITLNRLHSGGQQFMTVQHVQVSDGGQAVINGSVQTGANRK
ncbi:MAG: hypothetical protein A3J37_07270 [Alphaproteobacteria bacterium RIFCSPHIGHO2_12_FULL_45_9]|nr:MAG: hypothetical protein A3B66_04760 [Alphaproteobacteria bacterium RIFCSPHIGHO2_02_FULL_46_13]OFW96861.1 MAG: hypothetical protein A3J37_07270 [Alphaproteobacteria bacterium RIFCSPHIGHO2_12_FULL_45_9]